MPAEHRKAHESEGKTKMIHFARRAHLMTDFTRKRVIRETFDALRFRCFTLLRVNLFW
jgi:hypothetical protein